MVLILKQEQQNEEEEFGLFKAIIRTDADSFVITKQLEITTEIKHKNFRIVREAGMKSYSLTKVVGIISSYQSSIPGHCVLNHLIIQR